MAALHSTFLAHRLWWALAGMMLAVLMVVGLVQGHRAEAQLASATATIPPAKAAALVEATSADATIAVKAVGDEAKLINAALPFDTAPVRAVRSFEIGSAGVAHHRALLCLTQAVYYEAASEPLAGRRAVAQVVLNRMRHPAYPKSLCGVVYQRNSTPVCQFSFVCDGSLYRQPSAGLWREARDIAEAALAGKVEQSVGSATHYHADYVAPRWAPMLAKVAKHGAHIFYRWPGAWGMPGAFTGRYIGEPSDPATMRPALRAAIVGKASELPIVTEIAVVPQSAARVDNDIGALLDPSKGRGLNIPAPYETATAGKAITQHQQPLIAQPGAAVPGLATR